MKLIVGLGNPGKEYEGTRHNTGWMEIVQLLGGWRFKKALKSEVAEAIIEGQKVVLVKPQTFMNSSGEAVSALANFYKVRPHDILLIHDDLDIPLGEFKLQLGRGPKCHLGVLSVEEKLGTKAFWRMRVGIANGGSGNEYVMGKFEADEVAILEKITPKILEGVSKWVSDTH